MDHENLKELSAEEFKRYSGVKPETFRAMLDALREAEQSKKKAGRSSKLSLEEQVLLTLSYWREYRTQFHLASSYGIHESTANRIIAKVEDVLVASGRFALPKRQAPQAAEHELVVVVVDSTETPIERPKKTGPLLQRQEKAPYLEVPVGYRLRDHPYLRASPGAGSYVRSQTV